MDNLGTHPQRDSPALLEGLIPATGLSTWYNILLESNEQVRNAK